MRNKVVLGLVALLVISIPVTLALLRQNQENRSKASSSTKLSFVPETTQTTPLQKATGDTVDLDVMVDPGQNLVTFVRLQVQYDATKLQLQSTPFTQNTTDFPVTLEGPVLSTGKFAQSLSVGSDPTKAVRAVSKIGTLHFTAIGGTGATPTTVTFTNISQALSAGTSDQAAENVLSTTIPAYVSIDGDSITPTGSPSGTILNFDLLLHGIGAAGDNPNPTGNSLSNKNPLHPERNLDIQILNSNNEIVASVGGKIYYSSPSGTFKGSVSLGDTFASGDYLIKIQSDRYLRRLIPGVQQIKNMQSNNIQQTSLVAGNTNVDNTLNVLDYNALLDCGYGSLNPLPLDEPQSIYKSQACQVHTPTINVDLDDNGIINSPDYNLFLRELSVQSGD